MNRPTDRSALGDHLIRTLGESAETAAILKTDRELCIEAALEFPQRLPRQAPLRFLDLGCGTIVRPPNVIGETNMPPLVCEVAAKNGWEVTGIDLNLAESPNRLWTGISGDLTDRNFRRSALPPSSYDAVWSNALIGTRSVEYSPSLELPSGMRPHFDIADSDINNDTALVRWLGEFFADIYDTLKTGGVFLLNQKYFFVKEHGLVPLLGHPPQPFTYLSRVGRPYSWRRNL